MLAGSLGRSLEGVGGDWEVSGAGCAGDVGVALVVDGEASAGVGAGGAPQSPELCSVQVNGIDDRRPERIQFADEDIGDAAQDGAKRLGSAATGLSREPGGGR